MAPDRAVEWHDVARAVELFDPDEERHVLEYTFPDLVRARLDMQSEFRVARYLRVLLKRVDEPK